MSRWPTLLGGGPAAARDVPGDAGPVGHHPGPLAGAARAAAGTAPMRLSELSDRLHIAPRSATEVVDALEARGLVERRPDPSDRRATLVELTEHGPRACWTRSARPAAPRPSGCSAGSARPTGPTWPASCGTRTSGTYPPVSTAAICCTICTEDGLGRGEIEAERPCPAGAESRPIDDRDAGPVGDQLAGRSRQVQRGAVQPGQVGAVRRPVAHPGQVLGCSRSASRRRLSSR